MEWIERAVDALALTFAVVFFPAGLFWLVIHPGIRFWRRFGNRAFWVALPLWVVPGITLVGLRHELFAQRLGRNVWTWTSGTLLLALAVWLTWRVHREFSLRRLAGFPELSPQRYRGGVVRSGIYGIVRHPRYLGFMLSFLGLALLTGAAGIFALAIVTILLYLIVAPLEERELREHYGSDYEAYIRDVPRFLPRWRWRTRS
jgi:protein-S-isoprenylcysteine O-methyltransferase Ste14